MKKFFVLTFCIFFLFGCSNEEASKEEKNDLLKVTNSTLSMEKQDEDINISDHLENLATSIPNVKDAKALTIGDYALVYLDVEGDLERSEVGTIKYSVAESLKNDPFGANSAIIAGPDIIVRYKEWWEDIKGGRPISGFFHELADVIGRYMPEIPADLIEPIDKTPTDDAKQGLNNSNENNLEQQQNEQSNNYM